MNNSAPLGDYLPSKANSNMHSAATVVETSSIPIADSGMVTTVPNITPIHEHSERVPQLSGSVDFNKGTENEQEALPEMKEGKRKRKPRISPDYLYTPVATQLNTKLHGKREQKIIKRNPFKDMNPDSGKGFIWLIETKSALPAELCTDYDCNQSFRRKRHYHCRLCDNSKLGPIETIKKYWNHLDRHLKNFIPVNGKMLCECRMHCLDSKGVLVTLPHFHCPSCPHIGSGTHYTDMLFHIDAHHDLSTQPVKRQEEEFLGYPTKARKPRTKPEELKIQQTLNLPKRARLQKEHAYHIKKGEKKNLVSPSEIFDYQSVSLNPNLFEVLPDDPENILAHISNYSSIKFKRDSDSKFSISGSVDDVQKAYDLLSEMVQKASQGNLKSIYNYDTSEKLKGVGEPTIAPLPSDSSPDNNSGDTVPHRLEKVPCVCLACKNEYSNHNLLIRHILQAHDYTANECGVSLDAAEVGEDHECDLTTGNQHKEVSMDGKKHGHCINCRETSTGIYKDHHHHCKQIYMTLCDFVWRCPKCQSFFQSKDQLKLHIEKCTGASEQPNTETVMHVTGDKMNNTPQTNTSTNSEKEKREDASTVGEGKKGISKVIMKPTTGECYCQVCGEKMALKATIIAKHDCFQKKINSSSKPSISHSTRAMNNENDGFIVNMSTEGNSSRSNNNNNSNDMTEHSNPPEEAMKESNGDVAESSIKNPKIMLLDDSELLYRCRYLLCKQCGKMLKTRRLMIEHIHRVHITKSLLCAYCGKVYSDLSKYRQHQTAEHNLELKAPCKICHRLILKSSIEKHLQRHEGKGNYSLYKGPKHLKCTQCDYKANFPSNLRYHNMKIHSGRYTCPHCSTRFGSQYRLEAHVRDLHTNPGRFECHICKKKFNRQSYLSVHIQRHNRVTRYHCEICNKGFLQHYRMVEHMEVHKNKSERQFPFSCEACSKGFSQKRVLEAHMNIHTGLKPYSCNFCKAAFTSQSGRAQHIKLKHNINQFPCITCGMSFKLKWKLKAHIKKHTGDSEHQCLQCGKRFTLKSSLNRHIVSCATEKTDAMAEATGQNCAITSSITSTRTTAKLAAKSKHQMSPELFICCGCSITFPSLEQIFQHVCTNDATTGKAVVDAIGGDKSHAIIESSHTTPDGTPKEQAQTLSDNPADNPALISEREKAVNQNLQNGVKLQTGLVLDSGGVSSQEEGNILSKLVQNDSSIVDENDLIQRHPEEKPGNESSHILGIAGQQFLIERDQYDVNKITLIPYSVPLWKDHVNANTEAAIVESNEEMYMIGHQGQLVIKSDGKQYFQIESAHQQLQS